MERAWAFSPQVVADPRGTEAISHRARLEAALRAGHGCGAEFELWIDSGPEPALRLFARDVPSVRWVGRVLLDAYGPHQWHPLRATADASGSRQTWDGERLHPWPVPLRPPGDLAPSMDLIALALRALPAGVRCGPTKERRTFLRKEPSFAS